MPSHLVFGFSAEYDQTTRFGQELVCIFDDSVCNNFGISTINLYQGNSKTIYCVVEDREKKLVDITDCKIWFTVKDKNYLDIDDDTYAVFQKKNLLAGGSDLEISFIDAPSGRFQISIARSDTQIFDCDSYEFDIQIEFADGKVYTIARGKFNLLNKTTQSY